MPLRFSHTTINTNNQWPSKLLIFHSWNTLVDNNNYWYMLLVPVCFSYNMHGIHPLLKHWIESVGVFGCRCLKQRQFSKHFELHSSFFHVDQPTLYTQEAYHSHGGITQCILHTFTRSGYAVCNIVRSVRNVPRYGTTPCTTSCIIQYFTSVHVPCTWKAHDYYIC